jgi:hypothetical protein
VPLDQAAHDQVLAFVKEHQGQRERRAKEVMERLTSWLKAGLLFGGILLCAKAFFFVDHLDRTCLRSALTSAQVASDVHASTLKVNGALDDSRKLLTATTETVKAAKGTLARHKEPSTMPGQRFCWRWTTHITYYSKLD